ncbi:MFS transporter [Dictyobacter aurantiacus]|uniref:MFS transporter n=2 Tax=Dictyobacter aurantiacus TaxID=1936993 RepID=A0A401ZKD4_9CHLR|nr:MFS transporter [Dictyobacter aurantiacus]
MPRFIPAPPEKQQTNDSLSSTPSSRWLALVLLCVAQFMVVLDVQVIVIALPAIQRQFAITQTDLQWIITAYVLLFGGLLMLAGRAADLFGRRRFFITGLLLFSFASLGCGLARSETWLIAARALQGLGAACISPSALAQLTSIFPAGPERNRALGWWGAAAPLGGVSGLLLGGLLTSGPGWPWVFFINVPLGLVGATLSPFILRESRAPGAARLDIAGALTGTVGLAALIFGLTQMQSLGIGAPPTLLALALALIFLLAFAFIERRVHAPLVPFAIFRRRTLTVSILVSLLLTFLTSPPSFFATLYLQQIVGASPFLTGLAFLPESLCIAVCSVIGARLTTRLGTRRSMVIGMGALLLSMLLLTTLSLGDGYLHALLPGFIVLGFGLGVGSVAATSAGMARIDDTEQGLVAGLLNTAAQLGTVLGLALLDIIAATATTMLKSISGTDIAALIGGFRWAFIVSAAVALAGILITSRSERP